MLTPTQLSQLLQAHLPAADHHGEIVEEIGINFVKLRLPMQDTYVSRDLPRGSGQVVASGPLTMALADTAMYACVHAFCGTDVFTVLANFNATFLRIAGAADLIAVARLLKRGKSLAFLECHLYSGNSIDPAAHVTATYSVRAITR